MFDIGDGTSQRVLLGQAKRVPRIPVGSSLGKAISPPLPEPGSSGCAAPRLTRGYERESGVNLLPTAYCLLPTAYCLVPTAHYRLPALAQLAGTAT